MFINAQLRDVSSCFKPFIPSQKVETFQRALVEMTNNDLNAWTNFNSACSSHDYWNGHNVSSDDSDKVQTQSIYSQYFPQETFSGGYLPTSSSPSPRTFAAMDQEPKLSHAKTTIVRPCFREQTYGMEYLRSTEDLSHIEYTTLGNECSNLVVMPKRDSDLKDPGYRLHHDGINSSYPSSSETRTAYSSGFPESFTVVSSSGPKSIGNTWEYADFSARNSIIDPEDLITIGSQPLSVPEFSDMWPKIAHQHPEQPWSHIGTSNSGNDGLPRFPPDEEQHGNFWEPDPIQPQPAPLNNVSEESLSFDVLGLGMSTSASSSENLPCCSDQHTGSRINSSRRKQTKIKSAKGIQKALTDGYRQKLPMVPLSSQRASVVIPKEADSAGEHNKKGLSRHRLGSHSKTKSLSTRKKPIAKSETIHMENKVGQSSYKQEERDCEAVLPIYQDPAETDANLLSCGATASTATSPTESSTDRASAIRKPEDEFLVKSRLSGMAYKAIRQQGNFTEAESTLRGRFRTLTKHKTARVRKPEWSDNDIQLLRRAVRRLSRGSSKSRIPWKSVAEYIADNGGSYHFGYATCRKRWDELQADSGS